MELFRGLSLEGFKEHALSVEPGDDSLRYLLSGTVLDRAGPGALLEMHAATVPLVATLALPCEDRIVLKLVEPAPHERVADLEFVIQEPERQGPVHRFDPERQPPELDR